MIPINLNSDVRHKKNRASLYKKEFAETKN